MYKVFLKQLGSGSGFRFLTGSGSGFDEYGSETLVPGTYVLKFFIEKCLSKINL